MENLETPQERLKYFIKKQFRTLSEFCSKVGITQQALNKYINTGTFIMQKVNLVDMLKENNLNYNWYLTGEGEMLINNSVNINHDNIGVPYYDIDVFAHYGEGFDDKPIVPLFYIDFNPLNNATAYVNVYGDSMLPEYKSGEIIAIKEITNKEFIIWGETYLIITNNEYNNMKLLKNIYQYQDNSKIILKSINPLYNGEMIIPINAIISLFVVLGKFTKKHI